MQRRGLLKLGLFGGAAIAAAAAGIALTTPRGWENGKLSRAAADMWTAVAATVLDALVPQEPQARAQALGRWLLRLEATISSLPPHAQDELAQLCTLLPTAPGRLALAGLGTDWSSASQADVAACLRQMQTSRLSVRQQLYHALRDLTNAAWFSEPAHWAAIGYPGPRDI